MTMHDVATAPTLRSWTPADSPSIETLLDQCEPLQRWLDQWVFSAPDPDRWLLACHDDQVVGVAARRHSPIHPHRDWAAVVVAEEHRQTGVARTLLRQLADLSTRGLRLRTVDGAAGEAFATSCGLTPAVRCIEIELAADPVFIDAWSGHAAEASVSVRSSSGRELADALQRHYATSHRWDRPGAMKPDEWRQILTGDAIPGSGRVALVDGEVVAAGVLHPASDRSPCDAHLAFCGPVDQQSAVATAATAALVADYARWIGRISVEIDVGNGANHALATVLGARDEPVPGSVRIFVRD